MKFQHLLSIMALGASSLFLFSACGSDSDSSTSGESTTETTNTQPAADAPVVTQAPTGEVPVGDPASSGLTPTTIAPMPAQANPAKQEPPQNAAGVWHYTCPKGCKGGAGAASPCAKCGTTLAHNAAYHPTPAPATTATPAGLSDQTGKPATPKQEPPQNKAGVWHYICIDGCAGGGGAAVACPKCSKMMVHNAAYHQ